MKKHKPPLQPAFYDTAPPEAAVPAAGVHERALHQPVHEKEESKQAEEPSPAQSQTSTGRQQGGDTARPPLRRRRRGRGGRGRSRGTSEAASPAGTTLEPEAKSASVSGNQAVVPAAPPRPSKGLVILAIGLPGSGKSSWFKRNKITPLLHRSVAGDAV